MLSVYSFIYGTKTKQIIDTKYRNLKFSVINYTTAKQAYLFRHVWCQKIIRLVFLVGFFVLCMTLAAEHIKQGSLPKTTSPVEVFLPNKIGVVIEDRGKSIFSFSFRTFSCIFLLYLFNKDGTRNYFGSAKYR